MDRRIILNSSVLEIVVGPNTTPQNRLVRTLNTSPHDEHYWAWFVDINGRWPDSGNLIAGGPMDFGEALIPS
ncbi:hypothetical protein MTR_4g060450 [Medicago truncatula]|uniref:Uncharacterized protein n=1 Tax=Medicago truncatula TaxID=3880 RepID=G7JQF4_MEDTR|nr:hypothetical protein MTR_4g060450 [Medicago truncatula]